MKRTQVEATGSTLHKTLKLNVYSLDSLISRPMPHMTLQQLILIIFNLLHTLSVHNSNSWHPRHYSVPHQHYVSPEGHPIGCSHKAVHATIFTSFLAVLHWLSLSKRGNGDYCKCLAQGHNVAIWPGLEHAFLWSQVVCLSHLATMLS